MSNVLVFGSSGQLGQCLKYVAGKNGITNVIFPPEEQANILNIDLLTGLFNQYKPAYCINCAAYTAVDKAEDDIDMARKINRDGAENLAKLCAGFNATLIHISTDFVFEGNTVHPLSED